MPGRCRASAGRAVEPGGPHRKCGRRRRREWARGAWRSARERGGGRRRRRRGRRAGAALPRVAQSTDRVAIQTRQAPSMCAPTRSDRQVGEVLHEADQPLAQLDREQHRRPRVPRPSARRPRAARTSSATVRPISRNTRSAWTWEMACGSSPLRSAFCVAGVRAAAGDQHADHDHRRADRRGEPGQRPGRARARSAGPARRARWSGARTRTRRAAAASTRRKCSPTTHGLRSVRTVMPPITACAGDAEQHRPGEQHQGPAARPVRQRGDQPGQRDQPDARR